ncbi:hypothetical protein [Pseudoruegeria sp. SHC-113]|uniref:hypothetical protein n=1 Tax=Pseudoruegeria sp. SHC-113 TaxID=2855439 RepID=UPI0021BA6CC8|nr:hypothetical protein [Pseudoruegeria sp. SHC-113]MCT8160749.1 hypothetical protein [Pseudoruegeria sp. SHC-113]
MIVIAGFVLGGVLGALRAKKRGGNGKDIAQWAIVHAILFALIGLFATLFIHRSL